jgi:putative tricarboxylic transport membrane protein
VIVAASAATLWKAWKPGEAGDEPFVTRAQLRSILALLLPAAIYTVAIGFIGIYVASCGFLAYFMLRHGKHRGWTTAAVALGLPALLFMMFEVWFRTPLPKGPLEALLGLH